MPIVDKVDTRLDLLLCRSYFHQTILHRIKNKMILHITSTLFILISVLNAAAAKAGCVGMSNVPKAQDSCRNITTIEECLTNKSVLNDNVSASCFWHQLRGDKVLQTQYISSRGGPLVSRGLYFDGSLCGLRITVTIPSDVDGLWGATFRIIGGPSKYTDGANIAASPKVPISSSTCVVGRATGSKCTAELVAPEGYAKIPGFRNNTAIISFFTVVCFYRLGFCTHNHLLHVILNNQQSLSLSQILQDPERISTWRKKKILDPTQAFNFRTEYEFIRCKKTPYPGNNTAISDKAVFGPTTYQLFSIENPKDPNEIPGGYSMVSYRAYRLTNITGAAWTARVGQSLSPDRQTTPISVMLLTEHDYLKWSKSCKGTCQAPKEKALKGTLCEGQDCSGSRAELYPSHVYRLLVAYQPKVYGLKYKRSFSENSIIVDNELKKQVVKVTVNPQWSLGPLPGATNDAISGGIGSGDTNSTSPSVPVPQGGARKGGKRRKRVITR